MQWKLGKGGVSKLLDFTSLHIDYVIVGIFLAQVQADMKTELGDQFEAMKVTFFLGQASQAFFLGQASQAMHNT